MYKEKQKEEFVDASRIDWFDKQRLIALPALLVGIYQGVEFEKQAEEHLQELELLAKTYGIPVVEKACMSMKSFSAATFLTQGKLEDVKNAVEKFQAKLVIFDDDISAAQQRNIEKFLRVPVIDRSEVILGIFAERAKTREAKLQIELAQVRYIAPRLKKMWTHLGQQTGGGGGASGGGYLKGAGEKQLEIDRRILKQRLAKLKDEIEDVQKNRKTQRVKRERTEIPVFALVGYTNAGKSTLMKQLSKADVFIEDKLFATLDTTTRKFSLSDKQDVLLIDTVGFIRKLPHLLVAAFRSTLEEAVQADVILHVVDASHPMAMEQAAVTLQVLKELNVGDRPIITVLNKIDQVRQLPRREAYQKLRLTYPRSIEISAREGEGIFDLEEAMRDVLKKKRTTLLLRIPQKDYHMVTDAIRLGHVLRQEYEENDVLIEVELPLNASFRFEPYKMREDSCK
jgi:GTP-binding protein HflX